MKNLKSKKNIKFRKHSGNRQQPLPVPATHKEALLPCFSCHKHLLSCSFTTAAWPLALLSPFPPSIGKQHVATPFTLGVFLWGKCQLIRSYMTDLPHPHLAMSTLVLKCAGELMWNKLRVHIRIEKKKKKRIQVVVAFDMVNATEVLQGSRPN